MDVGLLDAADTSIWDYALEHDAAIITKGSSTFSVGDGSRNLKFSSHEVEDSDHIDR